MDMIHAISNLKFFLQTTNCVHNSHNEIYSYGPCGLTPSYMHMRNCHDVFVCNHLRPHQLATSGGGVGWCCGSFFGSEELKRGGGGSSRFG